MAEPSTWKHLTGEIPLSRTRLIGVLNVTPDSFSNGGRYVDPDVAVLRGLELVEEDADVIDIGGESTRPGSDPVPADEEWRRVGPVVEALGRKVDIPLSIDTRKHEVARKALRAGASIVNDVGGLRNAQMLDLVSRSGAGAIVMHMLGEPKTMQDDPTYRDIVREVCGFLEARVRAAVAARIPREALALDPGFGFGKTVEHNLELLRDLDRIVALGQPVVVGLSRKSFLGKLAGGETDERVSAGVAAAVLAVTRGANLIRTHDVLETARALSVADAFLRRR